MNKKHASQLAVLDETDYTLIFGCCQEKNELMMILMIPYTSIY